MKYLLLGGAGFIGTHLSKRLLDEGHDVTVVDSLTTSTTPPHNVSFIEGDIRTLDMDDLFTDHDVVHHLASSVGVSHIDNNPQQSLFNNVELMNRLIPLFEKHQKKVIFASSSEIYGEGPFSETDNASIGPSSVLRWGYAASKLLTEFMISASTFPSVIVRFFNVTGPGQSGEYGMVLPRFIEKAKQNLPLLVYGNGNQTRSFCHVDDAVDALRLIEDNNNEIYNIGTDFAITILDLAKLVINTTSSESEIILTPYEKVFSEHHGEILNRVPNIAKLRTLGYDPKYTINDIIRDMV